MSAQLLKLGLLSLISQSVAFPLAHNYGRWWHKSDDVKYVSTDMVYFTTTTMTTLWVDPTEAAAATTPIAATSSPSYVSSASSSIAAAVEAAPATSASAAASPAIRVAGHRSGGGDRATTAAAEATSEAPAAVAPTTKTAADTAPAATTTAASSGSGSGSGSSTGKKAGVAFNDPTDVDPFVGGKSIGWCYNWNAHPGSVTSELTYIPLLWGAQSTYTDTWVTAASSAISNGANAVLGFNEPDHPDQANLDVSTAAAAYKKHITDNFKGKATLVSPAVTNGGAPMGLSYLQSFMDSCSDCGIEAIAIHWYDSSSNIEYFKSHIESAHEQFGLPIWLTEFGTTDGNEQAFLESVQPWLEEQDYVTNYAFFWAADGFLLSGSSLSAAGETYVS